MSQVSPKASNMAAARRGQIIQLVLVEGWPAARAAAAAEVEEQQVVRWVAAYRRYGMASLREEAAPERASRRWAARLRSIAAWAVLQVRGSAARAETAPCVELRRRSDDGRYRH